MALDRELLKHSAAALAASGVFVGAFSWKCPGWNGQLYDATRYERRGHSQKLGWGHLKAHEIANPLVSQSWELSFEATTALRRMRRRPSVNVPCYTQAELWP